MLQKYCTLLAKLTFKVMGKKYKRVEEERMAEQGVGTVCGVGDRQDRGVCVCVCVCVCAGIEGGRLQSPAQKINNSTPR